MALKSVGRLPDRETRRRRRVKEKIVLIDKDLLSETLEDRDRPADPWSGPDLSDTYAGPRAR
jgi:hypothetical protein